MGNNPKKKIAVGTPPSAAGLAGTECTRMIECATQWLPFGGVPREDIFVQFGIGARQFYERLSVIVEDKRFELRFSLRCELLELCRTQLSSPSRTRLRAG
ncbi:hypothetical protein G352_00457 [Rhodococcus ruber BKS 20-38]|uniref:DUF3263 domain-containing protein n=1 Tax=Rhodococcus ruber BKS 20-38 TaxID=1278076 RepID=M2YZ53_9NOCA|nr:hypothetical protein G352_00457 [Rhodococcus ruber BKS 20-38]